MQVLGFGSDADGRLLKSMKATIKLSMQLGKKNDKWNPFFYASLNPVTICLQDHAHILSKTRARLLRTCSPMRIGDHWITLEDLRVSLKFLWSDFVLIIIF